MIVGGGKWGNRFQLNRKPKQKQKQKVPAFQK